MQANVTVAVLQCLDTTAQTISGLDCKRTRRAIRVHGEPAAARTTGVYGLLLTGDSADLVETA